MSNQNVIEQITNRFGTSVNKNELTTLAEIVSMRLQIQLTSKDKRTKDDLFKWYDKHSQIVFPFIDENIQIYNVNEEQVF